MPKPKRALFAVFVLFASLSSASTPAIGQGGAEQPSAPGNYLERRLSSALRDKDEAGLDEIRRELSSRDSARQRRLAELLKSEDAEVQEFAAGLLAEEGTVASVSSLVEAIRGEQKVTARANLMTILGNVSTSASLPALVECATDLSDLSLHRCCRDALSATRDPAALGELLNIIEAAAPSAQVEPLRYAVCHVRDENLIPTLVARTESTDNDIVRICAQGLVNIGTNDALRALFKLIGERPGHAVAEVAERVLIQHAWETREGALIGICAEVLSSDSNFRQARTALECLVPMASQEATEVLEERFSRDPAGELRPYLAGALSRHRKIRSGSPK